MSDRAAALLLCAAMLLAAQARADTAAARPARGPPRTDTSCATCHTTGNWSKVSFDHARTGFLLNGAHAKVACSSCHGSDLSRSLGRTCAACHADAHGGEFGTRCSSCHEEQNWKPLFDVDAHRRTNFPLTGRHALLPCQECHLDRRDRVFTRATVDCVGCHRPAYDRTGGASIGHAQAGFSTSCRDCHQPWAWTLARFPQHEGCFQISSGKHAGIRCQSCHVSAIPTRITGTCSTGSAACTHCHDAGSTGPVHKGIDGYQWTDAKCYSCHKFVIEGASGKKVRP